jgi:hypothetical protein
MAGANILHKRLVVKMAKHSAAADSPHGLFHCCMRQRFSWCAVFPREARKNRTHMIEKYHAAAGRISIKPNVDRRLPAAAIILIMPSVVRFSLCDENEHNKEEQNRVPVW